MVTTAGAGCAARGRRALRRALLLLASVSALGCTTTVGTLSLTIVRSEAPGEEPLLGIAAFVRLRVDGPEGRAGPRDFPVGDAGGKLEGVPAGAGQEITVEGLGPERNPVSRGRSGPLRLREGDNQVEIYVGLLERFSLVPPSTREGGGSGMQQARAFHSATVLDDGSVLIAGGVETGWRPSPSGLPAAIALSSVERLAWPSARFGGVDCARSNRCMQLPRVQHSATLLPSGNVVLAGGSADGKSPVEQVEVFFTDTESFLLGPAMMTPRQAHAGVRSGESVALVGGATINESITPTAEQYTSGAVAPLPQMAAARRHFTLTRLDDGTLFAAGGFDEAGAPLASTELLAPDATRWSDGPTMSVSRAGHTATLLADGTVLLIGGLTGVGGAMTATRSVERFDPSDASVTPLAKLALARWAHTSSQLPGDGRVLVVGGFANSPVGSPTPLVEEITISEAGTVNVRGAAFRLHQARAGHSATVLRSGMLLVAGGIIADCNPSCGERATNTAEIFVY